MGWGITAACLLLCLFSTNAVELDQVSLNPDQIESMSQSLALVCKVSTDNCDFNELLSDPQGVAPISEEQLETYILQHLDGAQQRCADTIKAVPSLHLPAFFEKAEAFLQVA